VEPEKWSGCKTCWDKRPWYLVPLIVVLFFAVLAIAIAVSWATKRAEPALTGREAEIASKLEGISGSSIYDNSSPQGKATDWILNDDSQLLEANSANLIQRYSLAVLYFATQGKNWTSCARDDSNSTCTYTCYVNNLQEECSSKRYLSDAHECRWMGNTCIEEGKGNLRTLTLRKFSGHSVQLILWIF
jgi:hypothetical protein